jgi:hypothetical protein
VKIHGGVSAAALVPLTDLRTLLFFFECSIPYPLLRQ